MLHHPNRYKAMMAESTKPTPGAAQTTADRLATASDEALMAEFDRLSAAVARREKELKALHKKRWWQRTPPPLPEDKRGYQGPGFQLHLTRKALRHVQEELEYRRQKP
ncbi:MAG: hypothetical protein ACO3SP_03350 [Ilumatobacteraceae bacterium]